MINILTNIIAAIPFVILIVILIWALWRCLFSEQFEVMRIVLLAVFICVVFWIWTSWAIYHFTGDRHHTNFNFNPLN